LGDGIGRFDGRRRGLRFAEILLGEDAAEGSEPFKLLDGAAIEALSLDLVAEEQRPVVGIAIEAAEAEGQPIVAILVGGHRTLSKFGDAEYARVGGEFEALLEGAGHQTGFKAVAAEERVLREGNPLDGEKFLGIDGLVDGDEIGAKVGDLMDVLGADRGEAFRVEAMGSGHAQLFARLASGVARGLAGIVGGKGDRGEEFR
jgi:hypothetical protein